MVVKTKVRKFLENISQINILTVSVCAFSCLSQVLCIMYDQIIEFLTKLNSSQVKQSLEEQRGFPKESQVLLGHKGQ